MDNPETTSNEMLITLTADIVTAHVANKNVDGSALPGLISSVYGALSGLGTAAVVEAKPEPAVSVRSSVKADHIVCLECGQKMKMLKRHLMTDHGLSPEDYKARKKIGLGRKPGQRRGRRKKTA